jgi:hypothetical protein
MKDITRKPGRQAIRACLIPIITGIAVLILGSCSGKLTAEEAEKEITKQRYGLYKEDTTGAVFVKALYRPSELIYKQQDGGRLSALEKEKLKEDFRRNHYFIVSFSLRGNDLSGKMTGTSAFSTLINNLAFEMNNYIYLVTDKKDTVYASAYHYPRMYGTTYSTSLTFAFPRNPEKETRWVDLIVKDFGIGLLPKTFRFLTDDINNFANRVK